MVNMNKVKLYVKKLTERERFNGTDADIVLRNIDIMESADKLDLVPATNVKTCGCRGCFCERSGPSGSIYSYAQDTLKWFEYKNAGGYMIKEQADTTAAPHNDKIVEASEPVPVSDKAQVTTHFVENLENATNDLDNIGIRADYDDPDNTIAKFLARPYLWTQGSWTTASASNITLQSADVENPLITNARYISKLEGYNLMRGTANIKVTINANPFQQGRLLLWFLPCTDIFTANSDTSYSKMHTTTLLAKTMLYSVELDCRQTSCTLRIPYTTPYHYYDIKSQYGSWGTFGLTVLDPLATGASGSTSVDYTIYTWYDDVELAAPMCPQMMAGIGTAIVDEVNSGGMDRFLGSLTTQKIGDTIGEFESAVASSHPVSATLNAVGSTIEKYNIPFLPKKACSWVARQLGKLASVFGWSKPIYQSPNNFVSAQYDRYMANADGGTSAVPLALSACNEITTTDQLAFHSFDEMSWAYLKKVPSYWNTQNWATSSASGTLLFSQNIYPHVLYTQSSDTVSGHTATWRQGPPIYYLSNFFKWWRGGIKIIIKIIKTDFHSGRLQLTWTPKAGTITAPTLATSDLSLREVIDIRTGDIVTFDLPFYMQQSYLTMEDWSGLFQIRVLTQLRAPETAAQNIHLLLYVCGADDLEYSGPGISNSSGNNYCTPYAPQMNSESRALTTTTIGNRKDHYHGPKYAQHCMGEQFTSIKQLLNRYTHLNNSLDPSGTTSQLFMDPWFFQVDSLSGAGARRVPLLWGDAYSVFAPMYTFTRGSVNVMVIRNFVNNAPPTLNELAMVTSFASGTDGFQETSPAYGFNNATTLWNNAPYNLAAHAVIDSSITNSSAHVPYMNETHARINVPAPTDDAIRGNTCQTPGLAINIPDLLNTEDPPLVVLKRGGGDDFQFCMFVGPPPVLVTYV